MPKFPIATYAARLTPEQRDTFAEFARGPYPNVLRFALCGLERAAAGLSLKAAPRR